MKASCDASSEVPENEHGFCRVSDGGRIYQWLVDLFPICRSITGDGVRETLSYLKNILPKLEIHSVPTGYIAFDWVVPQEWSVRDAYVKDADGNIVLSFQENNLHLVSYSVPVDLYLTRSELDGYLHSIPDMPDAVPYVTSYYQKRWGFCIADSQRKLLKDGIYHVVIDSEFKNGVLNYGELVIPGASREEILVSTYVCHPSMANNELSGPCVVTAFAEWLLRQNNLRYTYRLIFVPETIGSIVYISKHLESLRGRTIAGFNVTCVGDNGPFSYIQSRYGASLADKVVGHVLNKYSTGVRQYTYLDRGSDERQYCSPLVDLPMVCFMRSKFGTFPEYHTSLDNVDFVSPSALAGSCDMLINFARLLECNRTYVVTNPCEPQLGKRGLYPTIGTRDNRSAVRSMMNFLAYCDGRNTILQISEIIDVDFFECAKMGKLLADEGVISMTNGGST